MITIPATPAAEAPLCDEREFAALVEELVTDFAPRLFRPRGTSVQWLALRLIMVRSGRAR